MTDGFIVPKETFEKYPESSKLDTLYDISLAIHRQLCSTHEKCNRRFEKIENRKWLDKGLASISGLIGGAAAAIGLRVGSGQ